MMDFFRRNMRAIFAITAVGFLAGIFIGFGGYFFGSKSFTDKVADVNGVPIPYRSYTLLYNRVIDNMRESNTDLNDEALKRKKDEVIQDLIQEEVFWQESRKYGIIVTDNEIAIDISNFPAFQQGGKFSKQLYFQALSWKLHMTPGEFEESRRRQIAIARLRSLITSGIKITDRELLENYKEKNKGKIKNFEKDKEKFYNEVLQEETIALLNEWYKSISASLKVKVYSEKVM